MSPKKYWIVGSIAGLFIIPSLILSCNITSSYDSALDQLAVEYSTEVDLSKEYLAALQAHDFALIEQNIEPSLKTDQLRATLEKTASWFPVGKQTGMKLVGLNRFRQVSGANVRSLTSVTFEYEFPGEWLEASMALQDKDAAVTIVGIHITSLPDSLENINKFTLHNKSVISYIVLIVCVIEPIFIIYSAICCIRTLFLKRKWLWIIFITLGFMRIQLNWTTGATNFGSFYVQLLGAGFTKAGPYGPLVSMVSIPLGAFAFHLRMWTRGSPTRTRDNMGVPTPP